MIDGGDGTREVVDNEPGVFVASHTYAVPGIHDVVVEVCDDDEGCVIVGTEAVNDGTGSGPATPSTDVPPPTLPATGSSTDRHVPVAMTLIRVGLGLVGVIRRRDRPSRPTGARH